MHLLKRKMIYGAVLIILFIFLAAGNVFGASLQDAAGKLETSGGKMGFDTGTDIEFVIGNIIEIILSFLGVIFLILTIYGGFLWMTASGNDEQIGKAKKLIKNSVIGIVIVFGAYVITSFIINYFVGSSAGESQLLK